MRSCSRHRLAVVCWAGSFLGCPQLLAEPTADAAPLSTQENDNTTTARAPRPGWYLGRQIAPTMSASGADWLTRESREREEQPIKLLLSLELKPKQQVCDFGCGNGYYTLHLARRVGPGGKVFAVDIQQEMLTLLEGRARPRGLNNIVPILATLTDPKLPLRQLDFVLMVDVYHELSEPTAILRAIHASLNETGRIAIVEFREEDPEVPILPLHKMSQAQVMKEIGANGFKLVGQFDQLPWQHVLFFSRDDSPLPRQQLKAWQSKELIPEAKSITREDPGAAELP